MAIIHGLANVRLPFPRRAKRFTLLADRRGPRSFITPGQILPRLSQQASSLALEVSRNRASLRRYSRLRRHRRPKRGASH